MPDEHAHIAADLRALAVPIADLTLDPVNARKHDDANLDAIETSFRRFGQYLPIVVQRTGMIVRIGNGRVTVARERMKWTHIAALIVDDEDVDAIERALIDNRSAELARWDEVNLKALVKDVDAAKLGFDDKALNRIFGTTPRLRDVAAQVGEVTYKIIITCDGDEHQAETLAKLEAEGYTCQPVVS